MTTAMNVLRRLSARQPATGLPREFYVDERVFELDLELIFYRQWLFAAHESELPQPGSYLTLQVGAYPIVLVRGGSGLIRAFVNSCRHRGSRLCRAERGRAARLVCPYHQWTYDLDGRLFAARQMGAGFDRGAYALKQLHCETVAGYIFICLAAQAPDFSATRAQLSALPRAAPARRGTRRLRVDHHRGRQLEARVGEQPRVLSLRGQPP